MGTTGPRRSWAEVCSFDQRRAKQKDEVQNIMDTIPSEPDQLDAIAKSRGWYDPYGSANAIIKQYMSNSLSVSEAANPLASLIDELYTTANHGRALYDSEMVARNQRPHWGAEAEQRWGVPEHTCQPPQNEDVWQRSSAESSLWRLWYAVLHWSRKTPWDDEVGQNKLLELVEVLKSRPDPPLPENATVPLRNDWIWSSGKVWSNLIMLGPSARESWNDSPGCGAGFSLPEIHAWANTNAFVARLSISNIASFWNYGSWAMRAALEDIRTGGYNGTRVELLDANVPAAAAWIQVAGQEAWQWIVENDQDVETRYDNSKPMPQLESEKRDTWYRARWVYWREKFMLLAQDHALTEETRRMAAEALEKMIEIQDRERSEGSGPPPASLQRYDSNTLRVLR